MQQAETADFLKGALADFKNAMEQKRYDDALEHADAMVSIAPELAPVVVLRAEVHIFQGNFVLAAEDFAKAHTLEPDSAEHLFRFGDALVRAGDRENAESCFLAALQREPLHLNALLALGELCELLGRPRETAKYVLEAVKHHPNSARACHIAGRFLHVYGSRSEAATFFVQAIKNDPEMPEPYRVLANFLREANNITDAVSMYDAVLNIVPDDATAEAERAHCLAHLNDWTQPGYHAFDPATDAQLATVSAPWMYLAMEDNAANLLRRCKLFSERTQANAVETPLGPRNNGKIRVGYFSADFHDHATMHLLSGVLDAHDKDTFEIIAFSFGVDRQDAVRARLLASVDTFVDVSGMSDFAAAELAREHNLDIAIDLKGHTANTRMGIMARRVAPAQITWLGFPGSTGMKAMDYIIADEVVIPPELEQHYSEKVIALPGSYQPNDRDRPLPDPSVTRADAGLPQDAFVFASFNATYKVSPAEFDIWMELLHAVEGSVLWQLDGGDTSCENLRRAAEARGIDPARLIFAPRLKRAPHLSRLALADLFLDTFNCNAHTTASDALWAGVPVLTLQGEQFAARVAASLTAAAGVPETICTSPDDYKARALELARDPSQLASLRQRLVSNRLSCSLFDTIGFTRKLENALRNVVSETAAKSE